MPEAKMNDLVTGLPSQLSGCGFGRRRHRLANIRRSFYESVDVT